MQAAVAAATAEILLQMQRMQSQMDRMARHLEDLHQTREPSRLVRNLTAGSRAAAAPPRDAHGGSAVASAWSVTSSAAARVPLEYDQVVAVHDSATNRGKLGQHHSQHHAAPAGGGGGAGNGNGAGGLR